MCAVFIYCELGKLIVFFVVFFFAVTEVQFPCIRAIVIKSLKMKVGSLFIVTCTGGTIGRYVSMTING